MTQPESVEAPVTDEETIRRIVREEISAARPELVQVMLLEAAPAMMKTISRAIDTRMRSQRIVDTIFERRPRLNG